MEYKIEILDGYELVKTDGGYAVREKKELEPPRSWEEFCERYPTIEYECYIGDESSLMRLLKTKGRDTVSDRNLIATEEEAEAFLALMQLRQLRKAWIGDWKQEWGKYCTIIKYSLRDGIRTNTSIYWSHEVMSFPTEGMANDFLGCFKNLFEKAKILL